jgi:hypothetical protein
MDALYSKSLKAGDRTYFFDVKEAKNSSKYLTIAETRRSKEDEKTFTRSSVMVFDSQVEKFREAISEALDLIQK